LGKLDWIWQNQNLASPKTIDLLRLSSMLSFLSDKLYIACNKPSKKFQTNMFWICVFQITLLFFNNIAT